ncbi:NADPH-dependent F420 reductase [Paenarthrobacter sp. NPDC057981]|uniref:NADPH-dependent F420 reductase n=1 Tax=Paenarthrobacter sp. NPDC057981 TaxID=3346297 RepID=UPI0036D7E9DA
MTTVGLIGAGYIGSTLARLSLDAGHDVLISNSRAPESLDVLVAALGPRATAVTPNEAASKADLVIVTIPLKDYRAVPVEQLDGKVVIDTNNYYPDRDGLIAELDDEATTTSELLQMHLPKSYVVKAFNNIYYLNLGRLGHPFEGAGRATLPIAGDDADAKSVVSDYMRSLGYDALDVGRLAEGWRFQRDLPAYSKPYVPVGAAGSPGHAPHAASREQIRAALGQAKRYSEL